MLFIKRSHGHQQSSGIESCLSVLGLLLAIGLVGGLTGLIYGLIKGNSSATIGGGIVLGVSVLCSIILIFVFVCCLKNNNVNSNATQQRSSTHYKQKHHRRRQQQQQQQHHHHQQQQQQHHRQPQHHRPGEEITSVSQVGNYEQQQSIPYYIPTSSGGLEDSTNSRYGKQTSFSPTQTSGFVFSNQNDGSITDQQTFSVYPNI